MKRSDIAEIRHQFKIENTNIDRMVGYYVDNQSTLIKEFNQSFLSIEEDEMIKWLNLFSKGFGGAVSSKEFTLEQETNGEIHQSLMALRDDHFATPEIYTAFFEKMVENDTDARNRLYVLLHCTYDILGKVNDSEEVYDFIMGFVFPMMADKPALSYNKERMVIEKKNLVQEVKPAEFSFIFPSFEERQADIHTLSYCIKKKNKENYYAQLVEDLFEFTGIVPDDTQKEAFSSALSNILEKEKVSTDKKFSIVKNIQENINGMLKDHDESTYFLDKIDMTRMLTDSGASQEIAEQVMENYESSVKSDRFKPAVAGTKSMSISSQNMKVSVKKDASDQLEIKIIDGRKYLLLPVDCVEVNGFAL